MTVDAAVVVVNYASASLVESCLSSIADLTSAEIIVVDNFSSSMELRTIRAMSKDHGWRLIESAVNQGFGGAVDLAVGLAASRGLRRFLLLNPDAIIDLAAAERLLDAVRDPMVVAAPLIVDGEGRPYFVGSELGLQSGRVRSVRVDDQGNVTSRLGEQGVEWLTGACLAFHQESFDRSGGFGSEYFMYWEDIEFSYRATKAGAHLTVLRDVIVVHDEGGTQSARRGRAKSNLYYRYNTRNRLLFAARNLERRTVLRWILNTPAVSWEILLRGGRRQIVQSPSTLAAAVSGSLGGLQKALLALIRPADRGARRDA